MGYARSSVRINHIKSNIVVSSLLCRARKKQYGEMADVILPLSASSREAGCQLPSLRRSLRQCLLIVESS